MSRQKTPYQQFARVYDQVNHVEVAQSFYAAIRGRLRALDPAEQVLDLGCGTGLLTELLAAGGRSVVGVDLSGEMLAVARRRCRRFGGRVRFVQADFCRLDSMRDRGAAVMCGDVPNHIKSRRMLGAMFRTAWRCLRPGGLFAFETLNEFCFESYWDDRTYFLEGPAGDLVMECSWHPCQRVGRARMVAFAKNGDRHFGKTQTTLEEYLHDDETIRKLLVDAGFLDVRNEPWSPWDDQHLEPSFDRNLWCLTK